MPLATPGAIMRNAARPRLDPSDARATIAKTTAAVGKPNENGTVNCCRA